ncbi:PEP-CTERM sorting domain-containing protein [Roseateles sp. DC23W]|uniref:PEP-CTERM sorting domain-containing protein n=1 Tax=Pelomonas dachongensis TaxID=3299029 RepID=A0ABW7ELR8_9BURK
MTSKIRTHLFALALAVIGSASQAGVVETRFGSTDGLGIGLASGDSFEFFDLADPQADGTNDWQPGGFAAPLNLLPFSGSVTGASLQIFSGGWGFGGNASVYLNNQLVGLLTNGDADESVDLVNTAWLDSYDLASLLGLIGSSNTVEIRTVDAGDFGSLGYVKLTLQTQDATGGTVPEPASLALAAVALAGVALTTRRRRRD